MRLSAALLVATATALPVACERRPEPVTAPSVVRATESAAAPTGGDDWRAAASTADASALGRLDQAWRLARAEAEEAGYARQVEALGPLVDPNAGLSGDLQPAPGPYRCRTVKLGSRSPGDPAHAESDWAPCTIELTPGGDLWLTQATGARRSRGRLYPDTARRLVYLGAQARDPDQAAWPDYGDRRAGDQIGVFERIAPARWRLVLPWPKQEAKLEIVELVP